jgi:hypothetical protein
MGDKEPEGREGGEREAEGEKRGKDGDVNKRATRKNRTEGNGGNYEDK